MPHGQTMEPKGKHKFMIYLPEDVYERLRTIAFEERTSINKLVLEGAEQILAKRVKTKTKAARKGA
jgi:predicted HicB family RNase H-like nuclease